VEFGVSCFDDWVFAGLELGYFTAKVNFKIQNEHDGIMHFPAEFGNTFAACNVTLRYPFGERGFWYGGVGAGIARVSMTANTVVIDGPDLMELLCGANAWSFLGQGFTGLGWCLNDNWQLTIGYRLRYLSGNATWKMVIGADGVELKMKRNLSHAAEVGVMYRW
jgi:opacity protein-like surface antigen